MADTSQTVYDQIGAEGFERLLDAFYARVATDPVLRPMYPAGDLAPAAGADGERGLRYLLIHAALTAAMALGWWAERRQATGKMLLAAGVIGRLLLV